MRSLSDAWSWYQDNRQMVRLMDRLGRRYWNALPWEDMERDDSFRNLDAVDVTSKTEAVLAELDDIAIFVLFSVFEANVREHLRDDVKLEVATLKHPALLRMADRMKENIEEGSFYSNVLDFYKNLDHDLVEQVSQIRRYRNWVAHGRRLGKKPFDTTPRDAFDRLESFLMLIRADRGL